MKDSVAATEDGLDIVIEGERLVLAWQDIASVFAFKRDLWCYDQICLDVYTADEIHTLTEDMEGWKELVESMPSHLDGMLQFEAWFQQVAFPPFEPCDTLLYERPAMPGQKRHSRVYPV